MKDNIKIRSYIFVVIIQRYYDRRTCKRTNSTATTTTQPKKTKKVLGQPTYEKVNEELFLDNPLHVILNKSKLAYRIYVILIANKELIKKRYYV
jgi:hypothetical protein